MQTTKQNNAARELPLNTKQRFSLKNITPISFEKWHSYVKILFLNSSELKNIDLPHPCLGDTKSFTLHQVTRIILVPPTLAVGTVPRIKSSLQ